MSIMSAPRRDNPSLLREMEQQQIWTVEQEVTLRRLAETVAGPPARFLEVGTWCGDSALIFGSVLRERGGRLFCVDWWKGNPGTHLVDIANQHDIYSWFWSRVKSAGLEEVIIPIRGPAQEVADILRQEVFDLVFLDADHCYQAVRRDLRQYGPLVKPGGIFCGHDCEGRIAQFPRTFLESHKETDCVADIHCGVVLAVGEQLPEASLDYWIWSACAKGNGKWETTNLGLTRETVARRAENEKLLVYRYRPVNVTSEDLRRRLTGSGLLPDGDLRIKTCPAPDSA